MFVSINRYNRDVSSLILSCVYIGTYHSIYGFIDLLVYLYTIRFIVLFIAENTEYVIILLYQSSYDIIGYYITVKLYTGALYPILIVQTLLLSYVTSKLCY